jgi:hypothetical protein
VPSTQQETQSDAPQIEEAVEPKGKKTKAQRHQAFFDSAKIYPCLQNDVVIDEELSQFYQIRKHFLIMSEAGKPIYSRYGDEEMLAPFFATVSAIIHKV